MQDVNAAAARAFAELWRAIPPSVIGISAAEQIAWRKAKSENVGLARRMTDELKPLLAGEEVFGFSKQIGADTVQHRIVK